ncbi:MAG: hypothetical protein FJ271_13335 [Planctomycetes bacterium]|nr:hypothetical protein [Planctomycetota bacterium]
MPENDDDKFLYAAEKLQDGRTVAEVRKLLIAKKGVPAEEAQSIVLNVYAAQKLQEGLKASEVRELLLAKKNVTPEEARAIVAEVRESLAEPDPVAPAGGNAMRGWGITLLVLGVGSFILPLMGLQFRLLNLFGQATPFLGGGLAVLGAVLVVVSLRPGGTPRR